MPIPDIESANNSSAGVSPVLFFARPEAMSFLYRYFLSFTPVMLVILCIGIRGLLVGLFLAASPRVPALFPVPVIPTSNISSAAMSQYMGIYNIGMPGSGELAAVTILLVAPVGIFLLAAAIGSELRQIQMWTGPALTIILSLGAAFVLAGSFSFSLAYLLLFLQWIAFLVQPFSIVASVAVLSGTERFRRSIRYTITPDAVVIRGGVFKHVEKNLLYHRISRVTFEQDLIGSRFNYGTVIPQGSASRDEGASSDTGAGYAGSTGAFRDPLDCLFGILDPKTAQRIIERMMTRPSPP